MLTREQISKWSAKDETEIEALKVEDTDEKTVSLFKIGSPAAKWALQFVTEKKIQFGLPSLLAAMEIQHQKAEIDALAETIEGADLLRDFISDVWSCSRSISSYGWFSNGNLGFADNYYLYYSYLAVPLVLYR